MKVLHVLASNAYSGAENVVCQIIKMMDGDVQMAYASPDGDINKALSERGITFFPMASLNKTCLKEVIEKYKPDVVHAHDMRASYIASKVKGKTPLVSHIHNNAFDSRKISKKSLAYFLAATKANKIIWVSESAYKGYIFHKFFKKKSIVLQNVIDGDALVRKAHLDEKDYDYDLAFMGRLTYPKNPQRLINLVDKISKVLPKLKVAVIGSGELEEQTKGLANTLNLNERIDFLGFKENPYKILKSSKVMVMTSRWEGLPMCLLEGMRLGVPIVSTPTDGVKKVVDDGYNGYLSEDDSVLADRIVDLITREDLRKTMSDNALIKFNQINDLDKYKNTLKEIYISGKDKKK